MLALTPFTLVGVTVTLTVAVPALDDNLIFAIPAFLPFTEPLLLTEATLLLLVEYLTPFANVAIPYD